MYTAIIVHTWTVESYINIIVQILEHYRHSTNASTINRLVQPMQYISTIYLVAYSTAFLPAVQYMYIQSTFDCTTKYAEL